MLAMLFRALAGRFTAATSTRPGGAYHVGVEVLILVVRAAECDPNAMGEEEWLFSHNQTLANCYGEGTGKMMCCAVGAVGFLWV